MTNFLTKVKNSRKWDRDSKFSNAAIILKRAILVLVPKAKNNVWTHVQSFFSRMKQHPRDIR
jgi:hypothetical protein